MPAKRRHCVSITERTYLKLKHFCQTMNTPMAQVVEELLADLPEASKHESLLDAPRGEVSNVPR